MKKNLYTRVKEAIEAEELNEETTHIALGENEILVYTEANAVSPERKVWIKSGDTDKEIADKIYSLVAYLNEE